MIGDHCMHRGTAISIGNNVIFVKNSCSTFIVIAVGNARNTISDIDRFDGTNVKVTIEEEE